jgi:hypothetical protein
MGQPSAAPPVFDVDVLLDTAVASVRDVRCRGECRHRSAEECATHAHLVFPYRGVYLRHVGDAQTVADANHVLLFNAGETYRVSHPLAGGDASLSLRLAEAVLHELLPPAPARGESESRFRRVCRRSVTRKGTT